MEIPTPEWIRQRSNVEFAEYGYPLPADGEDDRLGELIEEAVPELRGYVGEFLQAEEPGLVALLRKAVRMLVEFNAGAAQMEQLETVVDFNLIQSFGASNYNESRRTPAQARQGVHPWPALESLIGQILAYDSPGLSGALGRSPGVSVPDPLPRPGARVMADTLNAGPLSSPPWPPVGGGTV